MNETKQGHDNGSMLAPVIGFALGAIVGGTIALLLAPDSGERTRRRIGNAARRLSRDARHSLDEARETVTEAATNLGEDVRSAIDAGREAFRHEGDSHESRQGSRIAQTLNKPRQHTP